MDENDEATNALIAKLLSEDNAYADPYDEAGDEDSDDSSCGASRSRKKAKRGGKTAANAQAAGRNLPAAAAPEDGQAASRPVQDGRPVAPAADAIAERTASGRRRRKDAGQVAKDKARGWTEEEETRFLEALELHGRDWRACAAHVASRDAKAFTSHAQKHFIKLALRGAPLPPVVAASGVGYTLSGKPLDPQSASARAYGFTPKAFEHWQQSGVAERLGAGVMTGAPEASSEAGKENLAAGHLPACLEGDAMAPEAALDIPMVLPKQAAAARLPPRPRRRLADGGAQRPASPPPLAPPPTAYMQARPRREGAGPRARLGGTSESLELTRCANFVGPPGSGAPLAQPFSVGVAAQAVLVMDLHAHLSSCEVIGLLGGVWDAGARTLRVAAAFPCRRAPGTASGTSCELDASAEVETRALMASAGLTPVGWYHSHPLFAPRPSCKDNENQRNYQALFRCPSSGLDPFVGAIVGPWDAQLPSPASAVAWWMVQMRQGALTPFNIRAAMEPMEAMPGPETCAKMQGIVDMFASDADREDLAGQWRPFERLAGGQPQGPPLSKLAKMRAALAVHLPAAGQDTAGRAFLDTMLSHLRRSWGLEAEPADNQLAVACDEAGTHQSHGDAGLQCAPADAAPAEAALSQGMDVRVHGEDGMQTAHDASCAVQIAVVASCCEPVGTEAAPASMVTPSALPCSEVPCSLQCSESPVHCHEDRGPMPRVEEDCIGLGESHSGL